MVSCLDLLKATVLLSPWIFKYFLFCFSIIIFTSPNEPSIRFHNESNHIINQSVLIVNFLFFKLLFVAFIGRWEDAHIVSIILFQNCIFTGKDNWETLLQSQLETRNCKILNLFCWIAHHKNNSFAFDIAYLASLNFSVLIDLDVSTKIIRNWYFCFILQICIQLSHHNNRIFPTQIFFIM